MSKAEVDKLKAAASTAPAAKTPGGRKAKPAPKPTAEPVPDAPDIEADAGPVDELPDVSETLGAAGMIVRMAGAAMCREKPLTDAEVEAVALPMAQLMALYDFGPKSPKGQAWFGLICGVAGVVAARVDVSALIAKDDAPDAMPKGEAAELVEAEKPDYKGKRPPVNTGPPPLSGPQSYAGE